MSEPDGFFGADGPELKSHGAEHLSQRFFSDHDASDFVIRKLAVNDTEEFVGLAEGAAGNHLGKLWLQTSAAV